MHWPINNLFPASVGINTFITIILLAPTTSCDGGALLTTQGAHICLILSLILHGGRVAFIYSNTRQDMVPWSIGGVFALRAHCALFLDYVPPEEPPSTPLGNALRIR